MTISALKTVKCDITGQECTEKQVGDGFPGWGQLFGIRDKNEETGAVLWDPHLCPELMEEVRAFVIKLYEREANGNLD